MNRDVSGSRARRESAVHAAKRQRHSGSFARTLGIVLAAGVLLGFSPAYAAKPASRNDRAAPSVSIAAPAAGSTVSGVVSVSVTASDNIGVARVDLAANGVLVTSATTAPYAFRWDSTKLPNGAATLSATAYDLSGNKGSTSATVNVANSSLPPSVAISSPSPGSTLSGTVSVAVSASSTTGIARVELKANGVLLGSDTASPYGFSWDTTKVGDGSVILTASAYDAAGMSATTSVNETISNTTTVTPPPSSTVPTLSVTSGNTTGGVTVGVYPADTSGLGDGASSLTRTYQPNTRVWLSAALRSGNNYFVKWQKDGVDYDTASTTSVVMDGSHALNAVYETPSCTGVAVYPGTDSLLNAVAASPAGTTFCLKAGVHRVTSRVMARTNDKYIGEPGAILSGAKVVSSFVQSGSYWVAGGQSQQETPFPATAGGWPECVPTAPACIYPEMVFFDSRDLWQVATLAEVGPGKFYFDYANDRIYLGDNPTGHLVEATTGSGGLVGYSGGASDSVTVKNLVFEKFGGGEFTGYEHNALKAVNGWTIQNNEFRLIAFMAVANFGKSVLRNNYIHHNGRYGVVGDGTIEGNVITYTNTHGWTTGTDAGAAKFHGTSGMVLRGNIVSNNQSRGLWTDYDNINVTYENNIVTNNYEMGILHEVSCATVIRNNVLYGNNYAFPGKALSSGAQIYARSSKDVQIYGNDVTAKLPGVNGIGAYGDFIGSAPQSYTGTNCGTIYLQNIQVHDNVVRLDVGQQTGNMWGGGAYGIFFTNNTYYLKDLAGSYFWYNGGPWSKGTYQSAGGDATGKFLQW
jgi:parallel beta-helix repeat protein